MPRKAEVVADEPEATAGKVPTKEGGTEAVKVRCLLSEGGVSAVKALCLLSRERVPGIMSDSR